MHSLIVFDLLLILFWFHVGSISANIKYKSDLWDRILQRTPLTERLFKHFYQRRVIKPIFKKQLLKWNSQKIKKILNITYDLEIEIKSNIQKNKDILIKKLLVDICELANAS